MEVDKQGHNNGSIAMHLAAIVGHNSMVQIWVNANADQVDKLDEYGRAGLNWTTLTGHGRG